MFHRGIARRWVATLLLLVFCTGLATPALAGLSGNARHTAPAIVVHGTCFHADAGASQDDPDHASGSASAADCVLAHLGQAVFDHPAPLLVRVCPCSYPPAGSNDLVNRAPTLEKDPPREGRTV